MKKNVCICIIALCILVIPITASADIAHESLVTHWGTIYDVVLADVYGDSSPELLIGTESGLLVLEESTELVASFSCDIIRDVHVANIDGAGSLDVIFGCFDGNVYYFQDSDFTSGPVVIPAGGRIISSAVEDVDNDGLSECVVGTVSGTVEVYGWDGSAVIMDDNTDLSTLGDKHNGIFDIVPVDPDSDGIFDLIIGFGYMDAADCQHGYVIRLDNSLSEVWRAATPDFVVDVETMGDTVYASTLDVSSYSLADGSSLNTRSIGDYSLLAADTVTNRVYAGSRDGTVYCMNSSLGDIWDSGSSIGDAVQSLAFDGTYLYAGSLDAIYRFGTASGVPNASFDGAMGDVYALAPAGTSLYYGTQEGELNKLFSGLYPQWAQSWYTKDKVLSVAESNGMLATASRDGGVRDYTAGTYTQVWSTMLGERATAIDANDSYQVFGSLDGTLECYNGAVRLWVKSLAGAINDVEIYDVDEDGVKEVVVAVGAAGVPNLHCYTLSTGLTEWSTTVPGGYVYGIGCGEDLVVACSLDVHGYDGAGVQLWNTDIGIFSSDASVDYTGDFSYAYVYSDIDSGECVVSALDLSGDVSWQYYPKPGEIVTAIASGDIDADGDSEVIFSVDKDKVPEISRYLHNYLYVLSNQGEFEQKLEQSRDTTSLDAVPLGATDDSPIALFVGTFGVDVFATAPEFSCEAIYDFDADTMKLSFTSNQYIDDTPTAELGATPLTVSVTLDGWETESIAQASGTFAVSGSNALDMEGTATHAVNLQHIEDSSSGVVAYLDWSVTLNTSEPVTEDVGCCTSDSDPCICDSNRENVGTVFHVDAPLCVCTVVDSVELEYSYNPALIPSGIPESDAGLGMYYWCEEWDTYVLCADSSVDSGTHTVTGTADTTGKYAVMTKEIIIPLYGTWNLVSWPSDSPELIRSATGDLYSSSIFDVIYRWNTTINSYDEHIVDLYSKFDFFSYEFGYWIHGITPSYWHQMASYSGPVSYDLKTGWNLISWPKDYKTPIDVAIPAEALSNVDVIYRWQPSINSYEMYIVGVYSGFTSFEPVYGYWVHCTADTTWNLD